MPPTAEPIATELLIDRAFARRAEIKRLLEAQLLDEAAIIALGKGKHTGANPDHVVTVVAATASSTGPITYGAPLDKAAEEQARKLAGEQFGQLFDRQVIWTPCTGFEAVAPKLLTPAKARDLIALCAVPGKVTSGKKAYLLWPK